LRHLGPTARLLTVRSADGRLLAALPLGIGRIASALWTSPYAPDGTPLIDRDAAEAAMGAALQRLGGSDMPPLLRLPLLPLDGAAGTAVREALARLGLPFREASLHARACLLSDGSGSGLRRKQRKEAARQMRRLAERGPIDLVEASDLDAVAVALTGFLRLESSGWKGRRGTAMRSRTDTDRFVRDAIGALADAGQVRIFTLRCGGEPSAAAIVLGDRRRSWFWKTAYDERMARHSPGAQLAAALAERLGGTDGPAETDSCASPDHPMIDRIWRGRREFSDLLIATRPEGGRLLGPVATADEAARTLRAAARGLRRLLPGR
jgi:CelD/BcsL family acetyltransferase involved in cellulose biosynthesis